MVVAQAAPVGAVRPLADTSPTRAVAYAPDSHGGSTTGGGTLVGYPQALVGSIKFVGLGLDPSLRVPLGFPVPAQDIGEGRPSQSSELMLDFSDSVRCL